MESRYRTGAWAVFILSVCLGVDAREGHESLDLAALSLDELMEVEVTTPGKLPEAIRDTPASVYLVSRDDIETFGYASLTEILENVPGFYNIDNYTGLSGNFGVRGYWNGRSQNSSVAILLNGVPQMRPDELAHPMEELNVPVEAIDRIEISRGPNSVIYGNGASFGAINIITDDSFNNNQVTVSTGSNNTHRIAGRFSEFGEDFHLIVNAGHFATEGYDYDLLEMVGEDRVGLLPSYGVDSSSTSLEKRLEQRTNYFQASGSWKYFYLDYLLNESDVESFTGFPAVEGGNLRSNTKSQISLGVDVPLMGEYNLDTRFTYLDLSSDAEFDGLYPGLYGINQRDFENYELESLLTYVPSDDFQFVGGINLQRMENFLEYTSLADLGILNESVVIDSRELQSIFGQVSLRLTDTLRAVAGYRLERMKEFERYVYSNEPVGGEYLPNPYKGGFKNGTPRFSLIYQPNDAHVVKFMVGDAVKIPVFNDTGFESERTRTVELNYSWSSESVFLTASLFHNSLENLLLEEFRIPPGGVGQVDFDLVPGGEVETNGVEVVLRNKFTDTLHGEIGYTWQDSDNSQNPSGLLSYSPESVAHLKLTYRRDQFTLAALGRYIDEMASYYSSEELGDDRFWDTGYFGDPADDYFVMDLKARMDNVWKDVFLALALDNVFDQEIRYPSNPINGLLLNRGTLGPGRAFSVKLGVEF